MVTNINHDLRVINGRTLVMPAWKGGQEGFGNLTPPDIRDVHSVQQYPVGTKLQDGERVFYYAQTASGGNGITVTDLAVKQKYNQAVGNRTITVAQVAGDKSITLTTAGNDGFGGSGTVTKNELAGGFILVFPGDNDAFMSRIVSNTLAASTSMTVILQDEIPVTVAVNKTAECIANQFTGLETQSTSGDEETPVAGAAHAKVTAGYWFWLQTWGPIWFSPDAAVGNAVNDHMVVFGGDGALREVGSSEQRQVAGFGLAQAYGGGQGAPFIFLQITP